MIYLVDLNYTLVANSPKKGEPRLRPFNLQVEQELYRLDLVEFLRNKHTILITARPDTYKDITLARIKELTAWQPTESYFAEVRLPPSQTKEYLLHKYIFKQHGKDGSNYFGIESNPMTRNMYEKFGIDSQSYAEFFNIF